MQLLIPPVMNVEFVAVLNRRPQSYRNIKVQKFFAKMLMATCGPGADYTAAQQVSMVFVKEKPRNNINNHSQPTSNQQHTPVHNQPATTMHTTSNNNAHSQPASNLSQPAKNQIAFQDQRHVKQAPPQPIRLYFPHSCACTNSCTCKNGGMYYYNLNGGRTFWQQYEKNNSYHISIYRNGKNIVVDWNAHAGGWPRLTQAAAWNSYTNTFSQLNFNFAGRWYTVAQVELTRTLQYQRDGNWRYYKLDPKTNGHVTNPAGDVKCNPSLTYDISILVDANGSSRFDFYDSAKGCWRPLAGVSKFFGFWDSQGCWCWLQGGRKYGVEYYLARVSFRLNGVKYLTNVVNKSTHRNGR